MIDLLKALRPYQWSKNVLVFAALLFALQLGNAEKASLAVAAFAIFCAASSSAYLFNDIADRERDREHPEKSKRPIAAGRVSVGVAATTGAILAVTAVVGGWAVNDRLGLVIVAYLVLQLAYNTVLKHVAIVDALCVAAGFFLRAVAGAVAIDEPMSSWFLICTTFGAVFISFAKRRHEYSTLSDEATAHRESLSGYSIELLDQLLAISAAATLLSYALYTTDPETVEKFGDKPLILTLPFVIYGLFHYLGLVRNDEAVGDPSSALVRDKRLLITVALWALTVVLLLYFP